MNPGKPPAPGPPFARLSAGARASSLRAALAAAPDGDATWVFAYGSLMWSPCFDPAERCRAVLSGYHRAFTIWTGLARGTPEHPGLGLCVEAGGGPCTGIAYRLDPETRQDDLQALWRREMMTGVYRPCWLPLAMDGRQVSAIVFVAEPGHPQYAGALQADDMTAIIARAHGTFGPCRDYLANVVDQLERLGAPEPGLSSLLARVDARRAD